MRGPAPEWTPVLQQLAESELAELEPRPLPMRVPILVDGERWADVDWARVEAGSHVLGLKTNGTLWAWGYNYYGQLGQGNTTNSNVPLRVDLLGRLGWNGSGLDPFPGLQEGRDA